MELGLLSQKVSDRTAVSLSGTELKSLVKVPLVRTEGTGGAKPGISLARS